jgi:hypothetical protein
MLEPTTIPEVSMFTPTQGGNAQPGGILAPVMGDTVTYTITSDATNDAVPEPVTFVVLGGTHKVSKVRKWLARHPRYHVDFTPTSASWLNLVERLFAELTERCVRRGSHTTVRSLEKAMLECLDQRNRDPKPFVWTADADLVLGKVERDFVNGFL